MPFADFRQFLDVLRQHGELIDINRPVALNDVGKAMKQAYVRNGPAIMFNNNGTDYPLVAGIYSTRSKALLAFEADEGTIFDKVLHGLDTPIPPTFARNGAPCHDEIIAGDAIDIRNFPVPQYSPKDGGPYITPGIVVSEDPETGVPDVGHYRFLILGKDTVSFSAQPFHRFGKNLAKCKKLGIVPKAALIIGVDPIGSLYYDFVKRGETIRAKTYVVEGIGEDFFPSTMNLKILDDVLQVSDEECFVIARRLVKMEGLFTGGSGGGCISATLRLAKDLGPDAFVVALLPDTGMRYLSKVYNDEWMRERGYVDAAVAITAAEVVHAKHATRKARDLIIARPYQTVFHALKTMQEQDISQIPVFEENLPIGTIYEDQILNLALQGKDLRKLVVREMMSKPLPQIPGSAPVERITHILSHENPAVFVEMGNARFEILTKYDLMSTVASLMEQKR